MHATPRPPVSGLRPRALTVRFSPGELELAHAVAAAQGLSATKLMRLAVLTEAARLGLELQEQEPGLPA